MENINQRISTIIEDSGLSPSEFADAIEVPRSSISHIAAGRNKPSLDFLVKVKDKFPEMEWNWLIKGEGDMKSKPASKETSEKSAPISLPDLFSIIDNDNFGKAETPHNASAREEKIIGHRPSKDHASDSQPLAAKRNQTISEHIENQPQKIKRIILFLENGKFESYEQ